ncbi:MAG: hypothetical protein KDD64_05425 [Bdellovibrionales bacterium]|nr:hypothetical protein [Bdellovibrionales bacterium]
MEYQEICTSLTAPGASQGAGYPPVHVFGSMVSLETHQLLGILQVAQVPFAFVACSLLAPPTISQVCYGTLPFLKVDQRMIEDLRAQALFLDELSRASLIDSSNFSSRLAFFEEYELLDSMLLPFFRNYIFTAPEEKDRSWELARSGLSSSWGLLVHSPLYRRQAKRLLLGKKKTNCTDRDQFVQKGKELIANHSLRHPYTIAGLDSMSQEFPVLSEILAPIISE